VTQNNCPKHYYNMKRTSLKIDCSKTIIYKLVCKDVKIIPVYVGSTYLGFEHAKNNNRITCHNINSSRYNWKVYRFIRANGGFSNWSMISIEKYPCNDFFESAKRKEYYIKTLHATLNEIDTNTINEKHICTCGGKYTYNNKTVHCKTLRHIDRINLFKTVDLIISEYNIFLDYNALHF
jgi:hypothetical protein